MRARSSADGAAGNGERARLPGVHVLTNDAILARPDPWAPLRDLAGHPDGWCLHVRGPGTSGRRVDRLVVDALALLPPQCVVVNDRVDVALVRGLTAVHLGQRSLEPGAARSLLGPDVRLGVSVHGRAEARAARAADYWMVGHVFATPSHPDEPPGGLDRVRALAGEGTPLVAVGGISPGQVGVLLQAGAHGVAALRGVWDARSPARAVLTYLDAFPRLP